MGNETPTNDAPVTVEQCLRRFADLADYIDAHQPRYADPAMEVQVEHFPYTLSVEWLYDARRLADLARPHSAVAQAEDGDRLDMAKRLFWTDMQLGENADRLKDEWRDQWWTECSTMPLSGPGFLQKWFALADAALASAPAGDGVEDREVIARIINPDAFRTVEERLDGLADWVKQRWSADPAKLKAARELAQDNFNEDVIERESALRDADAILAALARPRAAVGDESDEPNELHERLGGYVADELGATSGGADYWRIRAAIVEAIERLALQSPPAKD